MIFQEKINRILLMLGFGFVVILPACSINPIPVTGPLPPVAVTAAPLDAGLLATFVVDGEIFRVWVTNPVTIEQIQDLHIGANPATIPNGRILRGSGSGFHNDPFSWHLDPQDIVLTEYRIDMCDGAPSYVEENLDEFVEVIQRYCPSEAVLVHIEDFPELSYHRASR